MNLVRLVVAGQCVHGDVDAGAEGELTLARVWRNGLEQGTEVLVNGPGGGKVVAGNEDGRNAVACACIACGEC